MSASITFTDTIGAATITNGLSAPGDRLSGWKPLVTGTKGGAGVAAVALGTGVTYAWTHRIDYGAEFTIAYIPNSDQVLLARLKLHLETGGTVVLDVNDGSSPTYTCVIWPGSEVTYSAPDKKDLKRTVTVSLKNTAAAHMSCLYA